MFGLKTKTKTQKALDYENLRLKHLGQNIAAAHKLTEARKSMTEKWCATNQGQCVSTCSHFKSGNITKWGEFESSDVVYCYVNYPKCKLWK